MALKLEQAFHGIPCEYWKITCIQLCVKSSKTRVELALYKDEDVREASVNNLVDKRLFIFDGLDSDLASLYTKIKLPIYETIGEPPDQEQVQVNPFVDAEDC